MKSREGASGLRSPLLRDAVLTALAVVLALLALDDITTDTAVSFTLERLTLAACGLWCVIVACRLMSQGRRGLGGVSLGVVALCALAQSAIGPGTIPGQVEYLVMVGGVTWFATLAAILAWFSRRADAGHEGEPRAGGR